MGPQPLKLRDIHLPQSGFDWWPPALGWWLLALLIPLTCYLIFWLYQRLTRKTAIKTAKKLLLAIKQNSDLDDASKLNQLSSLIRRVAISLSPRQQTASLTGQEWLKFLDNSVTGHPFTQGAGKIFGNQQYHPNSTQNLDITSLITLCEDWLKAQKQNKK